jgi:hypothetical protein
VTATTNGRWTRKTLDGLGRVVKVENGNGSDDGVADGDSLRAVRVFADGEGDAAIDAARTECDGVSDELHV